MKPNLYLFFEKLGVFNNKTTQKLQELEDRIKVLEEENISQTNSLYECWNSLDARIDILAEHKTDV